MRIFLPIAFGVSWMLFLSPLLLPGLDARTRQLASLGLISLGMCGPGIGALVATRWGKGKSIRSLRLDTLGLKRSYIWGVWHAPVIVQGHNYPGYPLAGIFMMIIFCVLPGAILSWMYLSVRSPWIAVLAHGAVNASAGLPVLFFKPGFNMALAGRSQHLPHDWGWGCLSDGWCGQSVSRHRCD